MKKLFTILAVAAAVVACQKNETIALDNGEAISFGNAFVENSTRATDLSYSGTKGLKLFKVYGTVTGGENTTGGTVAIFNGDDVTGSVGTAVWSCNNKQYWIAGATYNFAAVADAESVTCENGLPKSMVYSSAVDAETGFQKDLLYATASATGEASGNDYVNFTFNHLLSKVKFTVTSNTEGGYYYSVKNIEVANYNGGTYTIGAPTPWAVGTAANIAFGDIEEVTKASSEGEGTAKTSGKTCVNEKLLVPTATAFNVTFDVELYKGNTLLSKQESITKSVEIKNAENTLVGLEAGKSYNFTIAVSVGELIQFTVTTNPTWGDSTTNVPVLQ